MPSDEFNNEKELDNEVERLVAASKEIAEVSEILDLSTLAKHYSRELRRLKELRTNLVEQKFKLEQDIKIVDKRLEVSLGALKTLNMPMVEEPQETGPLEA